MDIYPGSIISPRTIVEAKGKGHIGSFVFVNVPLLVMGERSQINAFTSITGRRPVIIGKDTTISYGCRLISSSDKPAPGKNHTDYSPEYERNIDDKIITIGNNCFIGANSILMPGVILKDNTIVPAQSYVTRNGIHTNKFDKDGRWA
jgi:acetyltransferase-like isoleucine patch superfamily enzyme